MEKEPTKNKIIEIEPRGSYFEVDEEGYLINPASEEKIQEKWRPVIDDVVELYKDAYGDKLKQVYIRGSVAKGEAVENVSDIDTFAIVDLSKEDLNVAKEIKDARKELEQKYPFVNGIEFEPRLKSNFNKNDIILSQSLCIHGEPLETPKRKPGKEMSIHASYIKQNLSWIKNFLEKDESEEEIKNACTWVTKVILRTGFEITMERSKRYTRDLYKCYETFREYYPEKEEEMREVLHYALNPTSDKEKIREIVGGIGQWLLEESKEYFEGK
ncbi:MAG: nucleotidyltransferase domain-containing protein [Candidatus Nomurabacteria bacterium]|nr:MAG: nucleotidyltransferase domain-containing protein [Candidatus Nomurabacteria bacterium]